LGISLEMPKNSVEFSLGDVSTLIEERSKHSWRSAIVDRLLELGIVFLGVYAAFALNNHQIHKQERQRREQILTYLEKGAVAAAEKLKQTTANYDRNMNQFLDKLAKGEMPEIAPISWASNYNPNEYTWLLQAGGLELLDIETIARMRELDTAASTGLATMAHYQTLSDQLIVPHLAEGRTFFYDSTTKQLRGEYAQYPAILKEGSRILHDITQKTDQLVAQLRVEQGHRR
jgi:hypothetical protein